MTQTAHVAAREAVYQILREALRQGLELRPKTLRSGAALPHERIYESLIPLRKVKELQRRRIALDTANTCAPSTPEPAIRNRISHLMRDISSLMRDISSCTSRARASFISCPRALGCTDVYGFWNCLRRPWKGTSVCPTDAEHGKQGSLLSEGKGEPFSSRDIQRLPGSQRMSSRKSDSLNSENSSPPSQRRGEAS